MSDESLSSSSSAASQPFEPYIDDRAQRRSTWPTIFGAISLVLGVCGFCMQGLFTVSGLFSDRLMKMGGMEVSPPPKIFQLVAGVQGVILVILGVILIFGSAQLMMRRPLGATLVKFWVFARLVMVLAGLVAGVYLMKAQTDWQIAMTGEIRDSMRERGMKEADLPPVPDRESIERQSLWALVGFSVAYAVWPFVMAIVLTNRSVRDDIASWKAGGAPQAGA